MWYSIYVKSATLLVASRSADRAEDSVWRKSSLKQTSLLFRHPSAAVTCPCSDNSISEIYLLNISKFRITQMETKNISDQIILTGL